MQTLKYLVLFLMLISQAWAKNMDNLREEFNHELGKSIVNNTISGSLSSDESFSDCFTKPPNQDSICKNGQSNYTSEYLNSQSSDVCMRTAFSNPALGFLEGGLCWWHSHFQRNAWMFAVFRPQKPKDSAWDISKKIAKLYRGREVVEFNGYSNWNALSGVAADYLVSSMARKQLLDGFKAETWGTWFIEPGTPEQIYKMGREIERDLLQGIPSFIYLVLVVDGGIHAKIAKSIERVGHELTVNLVDSNYPAGDLLGLTGSNFKLRITENDDNTAVDLDRNKFGWKTGRHIEADRAQRAWNEYCQKRN